MMHRPLPLVTVALTLYAVCAASALRAEPTEPSEPAASGSAGAPLVCTQPLGPYDAALLDAVEAGLSHVYGVPTKRLDPRPLPAAAFYAPRQRWRADILLDHLDAEVVPASGCAYVMGFTSEDISTTKDEHEDWGILGLGTLGGPSSVVSTFRLSKRLKATKDKAARRRQVAQRAVKVANHELGHVLGLPHDDTVPGCLMNDAHGSILTVDAESGLHCPSAQAWIEAHHGWRMPSLSAVDWDALLKP